jgi:DNA-directed RNA polymerase specialized sigma24 family protein
MKISVQEFNDRTAFSKTVGYITEDLGKMLLWMVYSILNTWFRDKGIPKMTKEEIAGNVILKMTEKYLDKVDDQRQPYAFAIRMIHNLIVDEVRRLNWSDPLLGRCTTWVGGESGLELKKAVLTQLNEERDD